MALGRGIELELGVGIREGGITLEEALGEGGTLVVVAVEVEEGAGEGEGSIFAVEVEEGALEGEGGTLLEEALGDER